MTGSAKSNKRFNHLYHCFPPRTESQELLIKCLTLLSSVTFFFSVSRLKFKSAALFSYAAQINSVKAELIISRGLK